VKRDKIQQPLFIWIIAAALAVVVVFLPSLRNGFLDWDDGTLLVNNPSFRGLGPTQLRWMLTCFLGGPYQPLSWASYGLDYILWGMNPFGYHLTSLLLHAANSALFYALSLRLLQAAWPDRADEQGLRWGALFSALFFAIHPLRVESVAWATERRDVLSGFFYLAMFLSYLKAVSGAPEKKASALALSCAAFALGLLSKATGLMLPFVLLVLDVYPLRRLPGLLLLWEKLPYFLLSLVAGCVGVFGQQRTGALFSLAAYGWPQRAAQAVYGLAFYAWKTLIPLRLSPFYEVPIHVDLWTRPFLPAFLSVLGLTFIFFCARKRFPGGLAAWAAYALSAIPILGFVRMGVQLVADRYSYLPCWSWAALGGGIFAAALRACGPRLQKCLVVAAGALGLGLGLLTWGQEGAWHDDESLWTRAVQSDPQSALAQNNFGNFLFKRNRIAEAGSRYQAALRLHPGYAFAHNNLGNVFLSQGRFGQAEAEFREAARLRPDLVEPRFDLALALHSEGKLDEAIQNYRLVPDYPGAAAGLCRALAQQGNSAEAEKFCRLALGRQPGDAATHLNLGLILETTGRRDEAVGQYRETVRLAPDSALARRMLDRALAERRRVR
jgi:tetratricopeptide (TPR) repeat protein